MISAVVGSGGFEAVYSGTLASATVVSSGGTLIVLPGGKASGTVLESGGHVVSTGVAIFSPFSGYATTASTSGLALNGSGAASGSYPTEFVLTGGIASKTTLFDADQIVYAGGKAFGTVISSGGSEVVSSGGVTSATQIDGGNLVVVAGGSATYGATFAGTGGGLYFGGTSIPTVSISGFAAGDFIDLYSLTYSAGDSVAVRSAGIVTISTSSASYNLHIAGAVVGETDFVISSGTGGAGLVLTKSSAVALSAARMAFLAPAPAGPPKAALPWAAMATQHFTPAAPAGVTSVGFALSGLLPDRALLGPRADLFPINWHNLF
jgi:autotransporter passenger strand-loop-strand repeat protein